MDTKDIKHLAKLSKLKISEKDCSKYKKQLEETITYFENLKKINTKNIKPSHHVFSISNVYFEDNKKNIRKLTKKDIKQNLRSFDKYFITNKILNK